MRTLKKENILNIQVGSTFLAGGGGGSLEHGLRVMNSIEKQYGKLEVPLISASEMDDSLYGVAVSGIGSPVVLKNYDFGPEALHSFEAIRKVAFFSGREIGYLMSGEYGGFNTFTPMLVSMATGIPVLDVDGCGRAVPGLEVTLYAVNGIPSNPLVVSDRKGDTLVSFTKNPFDCQRHDGIARHFCQAYGNIACFATWVSSKDDCINKLAEGALSYAEKVGEKIAYAKADKLDFAEVIRATLECRELVRGRITKKTLEIKQGWDWGINEITDATGKKFYIDFKNENLVARWEDGKVELTCPDMICMIDTDTYEPLTNADTEEGQNVLIMAVPAHKNWFNTSKGIDYWRPFFDTVGYTGSVVRY